MSVSEATYRQLALEDSDGQWELNCGRIRQKPDMTYEHNDVMYEIGRILGNQLGREQYRVRVNAGRTHIAAGTYYIPDVSVIPLEQARTQQGTLQLEVYDEPLPLVIEVWSRLIYDEDVGLRLRDLASTARLVADPSFGDYDVETKLREYQRRGDREIWWVHPYERTITAWRRQPDGSYQETLYREGAVPCETLPGVRIDLAGLFD